jgi:hypothetical protein
MIDKWKFFSDLLDAAKEIDREFYHRHTDRCYGPREPLCVEHHAHTDSCWGSRLHCGKQTSSKSINQLHDLLQVVNQLHEQTDTKERESA